MNRFRGLRPAILLPALLALATLASYSTILRNDFVKFDDGFYILHNPHVAGGLTWGNLGWAFQTGYQGNWHPITWMSHMLDVQLFGLNPGWHHLINLLLHTFNALLLWALLERLTRAPWRSFFVAALFALHPAHVESVAWASERKDVLCAFFFLLMLLAYTAYATKPGRVMTGSGSPPEGPSAPLPPKEVGSIGLTALWSGMLNKPERAYGLALGLFVLALMSKPMAVTAPFVMLLLDFWPLGRLEPASAHASAPGALQVQEATRRRSIPGVRLVREKIPFFILAALSSVITLLVQESQRATYLGLPLPVRLANALASYWRYLAMTFWPTNLAAFYPLNSSSIPRPGMILFFFASLGLAVISSLAILVWRRAPWFVTGWFWFLGTLVPVIGLVQVGGQAFADRYTYIPLIGLFICIVWAGAALANLSRTLRPVLAVGGFALLCACGLLTYRQAQYWRNDFTLFEHALEVTPQNALAHYHVGIAFRDRKENPKAVEAFRAAIKADPSFAPAYSDLGALLEDEGQDQAALQLYQEAFKATPWAEQIHNHLGAKFWAEGKHEEALSEYAAALKCNPDFADAHFNLGLALSSQGRLREAASHFAAVCRLRPGDTEALACLAEALFKDGHLAQAAGCFRSLTQLAPTNAEAHQNLGLILAEQGEFGPAMAQFREAVRLKPDWPDALNALAWVLVTRPQLDPLKAPEAVELAERACQLSGGKQARFWSTLDIAYAGAGRFTNAIAAAARAKSMAEAAGQTNAARAAEARIQSYQQGQPYRP